MKMINLIYYIMLSSILALFTGQFVKAGEPGHPEQPGVAPAEAIPSSKRVIPAT